MECANCCKTTGPLFTDKDISRIAGKLRIKDVDFISTYLAIDEDGDYVLKELPCAFLGEDNFCSIYDFRPKACREFPHTDSPKQSQLFDLLIKNTYECPAALKIVEEILSFRCLRCIFLLCRERAYESKDEIPNVGLLSRSLC